jgi:PcaR/PcaU/PobR family beta-ketoadipate pathway transcriptional regulator
VTANQAASERDGSPGGPNGIQSVARAFAILELFDDQRPALSVAEITELTGLNRATTYRFCQTLRQLGYLEGIGQRRFRPGIKAVALGQTALRGRDLPELALPYLQELRQRTGETVNLGVLDRTEVVYVARVLSDHLISLRLYVGSRLPAYATSIGRAILAFLPEPEAGAVLDSSELRAITEHTIIDRRRLLAELKRVRTVGYAVTSQEVADGVSGVAAPVLGASQRPVAAVNISLPRPLPRPGEIREVLAPAAMETARAISSLVSQLAID